MELQEVSLEKKIKQHNTITSGRYDFSACQLDILFMLLANINDSDQDLKRYNIRVKDIELITGRSWNYQQVFDSNEDMLSRVFHIEESDGVRSIVLFSEVKYLKGTGSFDMVINPSARNYFFELKNNFTAMQLKSVLNCTSKYAKRLYGIACQWRSVGSKRFEITELKKMLGLIDKKGNEQFERISDFKKFVLDIARTQISENTDIELDYELKKRGREFYWVTLHINSQKFKQLEIDFAKPVDIQKFKSKLMAYGFTDEQAEIIAIKEKEKDFDILITELNEKVRSRKLAVNKSIAYLVGIYQKKGVLTTIKEK